MVPFLACPKKEVCSNHCLTAPNQQSWKTPFPVVRILHSEKSHQCCFCETQACCILTDPEGTHSSENMQIGKDLNTPTMFSLTLLL